MTVILVALLISGTVYPSSLSRIILARYLDSLSSSIISCKLFLSLSVSNLRKVCVPHDNILKE
ncbi:MAG: hypothetical protein ABJB76_00050 [Candidatus Nitrosocosmicus sp.]